MIKNLLFKIMFISHYSFIDGPGGLDLFYRRNTAFKPSIFSLYVAICWKYYSVYF